MSVTIEITMDSPAWERLPGAEAALGVWVIKWIRDWRRRLHHARFATCGEFEECLRRFTG